MNKIQTLEIRKHGENLNAIFSTGIEPVELCKKLRRLENKANRIAVDYCNGENGMNSHEAFERATMPILASVRKILFPKGMTGTDLDWCIIVNGDARGYTLKIDDEIMRKLKDSGKSLYSDWGGYGIIAPEF